jgi:prevent-host-death family protein
VPQFNLYEAKTQLSQLVERAANGEEVVIAKGGRPLAKLVRYVESPSEPRTLGSWRGRVVIHADFDELPPDVAAAFNADGE